MKTYSLLSTSLLAAGFIDKPIPTISDHSVLVKMNAVALNRRDYWITVGKYPGLKAGSTLGSDGCGKVVEVGKQASKSWLNKRIIINPNINWGTNEKVQAADYQVLGMPTDGTFAEYIVVPEDRLVIAPDFLSDEQCAAIPLGGLTSYRALFTQGQCKAGQKVLVTGIGGGVAQFVMQFAAKAGAQVYVTSGDQSKIERAMIYGAAGGYSYKEEGWIKKAMSETSGFDLIIDSSGGPDFGKLVNLCNPGGKIVFYGATLGLSGPVDLAKVFWKQVQIVGSTMGTDHEFVEMVKFIEKTNLNPLIDSIRPFSQLQSAIDEMKVSGEIGSDYE
jgi:zinc-binding alcohol dehydrogenase/oxidoreductase